MQLAIFTSSVTLLGALSDSSRTQRSPQTSELMDTDFGINDNDEVNSVAQAAMSGESMGAVEQSLHGETRSQRSRSPGSGRRIGKNAHNMFGSMVPPEVYRSWVSSDLYLRYVFE